MTTSSGTLYGTTGMSFFPGGLFLLFFFGQMIFELTQLFLERDLIGAVVGNGEAIAVADELIGELSPCARFDTREVRDTFIESSSTRCHDTPMDLAEFYERWNAGEEMLIMLMNIYKVTVVVNGTPVKSVHILRQDLVDAFTANSDIFVVEQVQVVKVTTQDDLTKSVYARIQTVSMNEAIPVDDALFDPALGGGIDEFITAVRALITSEDPPTEPV